MATKSTKSEKTPSYVWAGAIAFSLILGFVFLQPYLSVIALGLLLAFIFYPIYDYLLKKTKSSGIAATTTTLVSILMVLIPAIIIFALAFNQTVNLVNDLNDGGITFESENLSEFMVDITEDVNNRIESVVGVKEAISTTDAINFAQNTIPSVISSIGNALISIVSGVPAFSTMAILYLFVFVSGLTRGKELRKVVEEISPFDDKTNKLYISRLGSMAKAMIKGQMLIAIAQGIASAAVLALLGLADYFLFFSVVFTFLSFIPLGAGIITIPLGIGFIAFGNILGGILILLNHFVVVTNIDNYIRPKVVPEDAQLPAVLTILGAFAGVASFGFVGVIYGPMIMILIMTTIESYIQYKKRVASSS